MEVFEALKERRSVRAYSSTPIEDYKILKVLEAARISPSAKNRQEWKFIIVKNDKVKQRLLPAVKGRRFVVEAPVIIAACATEPSFIMPCGQHAYTVDLSIAMSYMILEAQELGLGTCWLGGFFEDQVKEVLEIPENVRVVAITPLGYPAEKPKEKPRRSLKEIVCYDKFE